MIMGPWEDQFDSGFCDQCQMELCTSLIQSVAFLLDNFISEICLSFSLNEKQLGETDTLMQREFQNKSIYLRWWCSMIFKLSIDLMGLFIKSIYKYGLMEHYPPLFWILKWYRIAYIFRSFLTEQHMLYLFRIISLLCPAATAMT